ncbi:hypothetical protein SAMN02745157_1547 [Kaistia soli DSM 19436]|uniref:Uncharacterized protein n=1 Tax=Kaistia soli DSM 19436 TaxID=1122133 RepID=A0A1M4YKH9_9HYPH|nr:hypothetical protein [Kaistia soli]SHF06240.1 hypothetical protein SAMN02745157_1547 [Kaistia soli DSM 19436]
MKERIKLLGFAILSLGVIGFGIANLYTAVTIGEVRSRSGWIAYGEQPLLFLAMTGIYVGGAVLFSVALHIVITQQRAFERSMKRSRPALDDAKRRPADHR